MFDAKRLAPVAVFFLIWAHQRQRRRSHERPDLAHRDLAVAIDGEGVVRARLHARLSLLRGHKDLLVAGDSDVDGVGHTSPK